MKVTKTGKKSLLTAPEACKFLGVKPQTLYAYVSRGQLRAEPRLGGQGHLYPVAELKSCGHEVERALVTERPQLAP